MKRARLTGLALTVVAAMSLAAASAVSAAGPLWRPANGQAVTGRSGLSIVWFPPFLFHCLKDNYVGVVTSSLLIGNATVHFLECILVKGTESCEVKSVGAPENGLILWRTLHGILGLILPSRAIGILWLPVSGKVIAEIESNACAPATKITGTVASLVEPTGKLQTTSKFVFALTGGKQNITLIHLTHSLGFVEPELVGYSVTGAIESTEEITFGEATEVT
jgi:hypothetical protein